MQLTLNTLAVALVAGSSVALASDSFKFPTSAKRSTNLVARQQSDSAAFTSQSTIKSGDTCEEASGPGYLQCGNQAVPWCYNPDIGQSCCSEGYACPPDSFCLTQEQCCPNGMDPETCASELGVVLPSGFSVDTAAPTTATGYPSGNNTIAPTASLHYSSKTKTYSTADATSTGRASGGSRGDAGSGSGTESTSATPAAFTGAAAPLALGKAGAVAGLLGGIVGALGFF